MTPFGNLYISDEKGRTFSLSITNVIKGTAVDFEKVNSLDGTYIINRYDKPVSTDFPSKPKAEIQEFDESDMIRNDMQKSKMQRPGTKNTETAK